MLQQRPLNFQHEILGERIEKANPVVSECNLEKPSNVGAVVPAEQPYCESLDGRFAVPRAAMPQDFTGERMTPSVTGQVAFEHYHRYCLARDLVAGRDVLDIASGEGYGAAILADVARSVVGVEIDEATVTHATAAYNAPNLRYVQGDALAIPLPDASVDVVVSFETLEHLRDQNRFLLEARRVLRPNGLFIVSTPDRLVYSAPGQAPNPYHVLELSVPEFTVLLERHFSQHRILAQRTALGSVAAPIDGRSDTWRTYSLHGSETIEARNGLEQAFYLIALASDGALPQIAGSLLAYHVGIDDLLFASAALARARAEAEHLRAEVERQRAEAERLQAEAERLRAEAERLRAEAERQRANHVRLQLFAMDLDAQLKQIHLSTSWRLTGPLRLLGRQVPFLARNGRRALRLALWTVTGQLWRRLEERRRRHASQAAQPDPEQNMALPQPAAGQSPSQADMIHLPVAETPRVTIIIPTYGGVDYPLRCLASIAAAPPVTPFEVLVADDATPGQDVFEFERVAGLRFIRWPENLGFLRSCNAAAKLAKGDFLFFLNNDTELLPGAVDTLVEMFDARPDAGMIGSKLIYPDGCLQEAGGIVWRDASAWNYGNRSDPQRPEFNYVREVDYISGAAIMLPRALWEKMGGFDEHFLPAYCEDSDLAFRLREAGWKVLYQPRSVVIHHEGISHGTDTNQGVKAHQVANTQRLRERWQATLERDHLPNGERVLRARDRSLTRRLTLVVDHYVPEPDRDAGSRTMLAFMDALLATGRVVKFLPDNLYRSPGYTEALEARGIEVIYGPWYESAEAWLRQHGAEVDEILLSRPSVATELLAPLRRHCHAPIAFYGHDLHFARMASEPGAQQNPAKNAAIAKMETLERRIWRMVDIVLYPSEEEAEYVRQLAPGVRARSVPAYVLPPSPPSLEAVPETPNLLFIGSFRHPPNVDAAIWLVQEILPLIRRDHPKASLIIIGSNPPLDVLALAQPGVDVRGYVTDLELATAYRMARVALCPLRSGAGVKLKVVEAMHNAVPVVTTRIGAQGLPGIDTITDIAEEAGTLAAATCRLLADDMLWRRRAEAQQSYVSARFSAEAMRTALVEAFAAVQSPRNLVEWRTDPKFFA